MINKEKIIADLDSNSFSFFSDSKNCNNKIMVARNNIKPFYYWFSINEQIKMRKNKILFESESFDSLEDAIASLKIVLKKGV